MKNKKSLVIITLVLCLVVGYAFLTTNLQINGNTRVNSMSWDVHFENLQVVEGTGTQSITDDTTLTYSNTFSEPGEKYILTVDVVNTGSIDAMIGTINIPTLTTEQAKILTQTITYDDGVAIEEKDKLIKTNGKETIQIYLELKYDIEEEDLPSGPIDLNQTFNIEYVQADSTAKDINHIPVCKNPISTELQTFLTAVQNNNLSGYNVGDTFTIDMCDFGTHTLRIANLSTLADFCNNPDNSQTACGVVLEFADIITTYNMNPSGEYKGTQYDYGWNIDGYPGSSMYTYLQNDIYNALPKALKNNIIDTKVISGYGQNDANGTGPEGNWVSTDKLYLLDAKEIYGSSYTSSYNKANSYERQLDYYESIGVTTSNYSRAIKLKNGTDSRWWLRGAYSRNSNIFYSVVNMGYWDADYANSTIGVAPAFRIA